MHATMHTHVCTIGHHDLSCIQFIEKNIQDSKQHLFNHFPVLPLVIEKMPFELRFPEHMIEVSLATVKSSSSSGVAMTRQLLILFVKLSFHS